MAIRRHLRLHVRATGGSTYGHDLVDDETGLVIGHLSSFVSRSPKHKSSSVYTLGAQEFATPGEFLEAYRRQKILAQRDAEFDAADPTRKESK